MAQEDDLLAARVRTRDPEALAAFLETRRRPLLAFVERRLGSALRGKVEVEDILQEASAEALRALPEVDLAGRDPFGWLCQIAERRIVDAHRRLFQAEKRAADRTVPLEGGRGDERGGKGFLDLLAQSISTASQRAIRNEREERVIGAIDRLPDATREAIRLRFGDGRSPREIAERLGKTEGAVRVLLSRALARLREELDEGEDAPSPGPGSL